MPALESRHTMDDTLRDLEKLRLSLVGLDPSLKAWESYATPTKRTLSGDDVVEELTQLLETFTTRSKQQVKFHEGFLMSILKVIYGESYAANEIRIKRLFQIEHLYQEVFVACPRRFGKSYSVGMFGAACLVAIPDIEIVLLSPSKRQSMLLLDLTLKFLEELKDQGSDFTMVTSNTERIWIRRNGTLRKVRHFYISRGGPVRPPPPGASFRRDSCRGGCRTVARVPRA